MVRARGECWRVAGLSSYVDCEALHLDGLDAANRGLRRTLLFPFDRPVGLHRSSHLRVVRRAAWYQAFRALASDVAPHDSLQTAASGYLPGTGLQTVGGRCYDFTFGPAAGVSAEGADRRDTPAARRPRWHDFRLELSTLNFAGGTPDGPEACSHRCQITTGVQW